MTAGVVLDGERAVIFDTETGDVIRCSVPTALENVANGQGRFIHGSTGEVTKTRKPLAPKAEEPVIPLQQPDTLPLPDAEAIVADAVQESAPVAPAVDAKPKPNRSTDPEREAVKKALKDAKIKFFGGASTEELKKLLPG